MWGMACTRFDPITTPAQPGKEIEMNIKLVGHNGYGLYIYRASTGHPGKKLKINGVERKDNEEFFAPSGQRDVTIDGVVYDLSTARVDWEPFRN